MLQEGLFEHEAAGGPEPIVMCLERDYYDLIWAGLKTHEFRKRFLPARRSRWFVYFNAPVSSLSAVIDLGPAVVDAPARIAEIAERANPGNGASVRGYLDGREVGYAIPILRVAEYRGLSAAELATELGGWHPPQGYLRLANNPGLWALCEKVAADDPVREMTVSHPE